MTPGDRVLRGSVVLQATVRASDRGVAGWWFKRVGKAYYRSHVWYSDEDISRWAT